MDVDNGYDAFSLDNTRHTLSDEPGKDRQDSRALRLEWQRELDAMTVETSVTAATTDETAVAPGDYTAQAATVLTIPAGAASVTFDVPTVDNDIDDGDRTFTVTLTAPLSPSVLGDATATGTITDDDTAGVTIDVGDGLTVVEGSPSDTYEVVLDSEPTDDVAAWSASANFAPCTSACSFTVPAKPRMI